MSEALDIQKEKEKQKQFILTSGLWKVMFNLSWPAIIAMVFYGLNTVLDGIFVGYFVGEDALAGVSLAYPLSQITTAFGSLVGVGAGSVLGIAIGRNDKKTQASILGTSNFLCIVITITYMIFALIFSTQLLQMMGGTGEALVQGERYFRVTVFGSFFWIYGLALNMIIRAEGKMKTAAAMMGAGVIINIIFNYIFMGVLGFGVEGSAWGTNICMFFYALFAWIYFGKGRASFEGKIASIKMDKTVSKSTISLGMSSLIMTVMTLVQSIVVFNALSKYGTTTDIAFYGVLFRIFNFLLTPIFGLMRALQPVISINFGAKQYKRVIDSFKVFALTAMLLTLPFWIITMISPSSIVGLMLTNHTFTDGEFLYARLFMSVLPFLSVLFMAMTFYPSIEKGKPAAILGIVRQLIFYVPVMIFLPKAIGVSGIYYGSFAIDAILLIATFIMVKTEFNSLRKQDKNLPLSV